MQSTRPSQSPPLEIAISDTGTTRTLTPAGELDLGAADLARTALTAAFADGFETIVLDLAETTFIDSTGIHLALDCRSRAKAQGVRFVVLPGPAEVQRVFAICGIDRLLAE